MISHEPTNFRGKYKAIGLSGHPRNPVGVSRDELVEANDYTIDVLDDCLKRVPDWIRLIRRDDSPLKRYIEGKLCIHFHIWVRTPGRDGQCDDGNYCIVIGSAVRGETMIRRAHPWGRDGFDITPVIEHETEREQLMLISRVQFLKNPEKVTLRIRSVVRLQRGYLCKRSGMEIAPPFATAAYETAGGVKDREARLTVGELTPRESPRDVVQSGPGIVDAIANEQCPTRHGQVSLMANPDIVLSSLRVEINDNFVGVAFEKCVDISVERFKMFLGTAQFMPTFE